MFGNQTDENSTKLLSELRTLETQLWLSHCEGLLAFLFAQKQLDRKQIKAKVAAVKKLFTSRADCKFDDLHPLLVDRCTRANKLQA